MKNLNSRLISCVIIFTLIIISAGYSQEEIAITVTNSNLGLVKEQRNLDLKKGVHTINLEDIPSGIQPSSVLIESKDQAFTVLEQNYEYDLINVDKVLNKSLNQQIWLVHPEQGKISGELLSASSANLILIDDEDNLQIIPRNKEQKIYLKDYSQKKSSFITKPTLVWKVNAKKTGKHRAQISYLSKGLNWQADYVGLLNDKDTEMTLACWVTVRNTSGKSFKNTRLKLMAGDLNILKEKRLHRAPKTMAMADAAPPAFKEKAFFEYHLYSLQRLTDLGNNQVKQIQLFPETQSKIKKIYRINSKYGNKIAVIVSIKNSKECNLGFALPAGTIRLYKEDGKDLEFIGENRIKHTAKDEELEIKVGEAFDIVAERNILSTQRPSKRSKKQTVEYKIRNHKDENIEVEIIEGISSYRETKLISSNYKLIEKRADYFKFKIPVKANDESILTLEYTTNW
jgi:hypothetical protein